MVVSAERRRNVVSAEADGKVACGKVGVKVRDGEEVCESVERGGSTAEETDES